MEQTFRQLQFNRRFLTAFRTGLAGMMRWHLMEMFAIPFCYPVAPVKEHPPRGISNGLGKVSVLYHIAGLEFLGNDRIKSFVVKKVIDGFARKSRRWHAIISCCFANASFALYQRLLPRFLRERTR